eukprot:220228_1
MEFKWDIGVVCGVGIILLIWWTIYAYKNNKWSISTILKSKEHEPLAASPIIPMKYLLCIRLLFALYAFTAWIAVNIKAFPQMYSFYTVWNYTLLVFYFCSASLFSMITYCTENGIPTSKWFNYYRGLTWIVFQCECSLSLLVDITVWCVLAPMSGDYNQFLNPISVSMHILNAVFMFTDLLLNDVPIHFHFGMLAVAPSLIYSIFSWIYYDFSYKWDYFFMDTSKNINAIWQIGLFTMHFLTWCFVWKLAQCKARRRKHTQTLKDVSVQLLEEDAGGSQSNTLGQKI